MGRAHGREGTGWLRAKVLRDQAKSNSSEWHHSWCHEGGCKLLTGRGRSGRPICQCALHNPLFF